MGGTIGQFSDNDDVVLKGGTDATPIGNTGDKLKVDGSGVTQPVSGTVAVSNFPATQNVAVTSSVEVEVKNDSGNAIPVSAASLPLPTGAATSANQATEIASLASIDAGIPAALGQTTMAASMPVTIASNQSAIPASQSGTWTVQPGNTANTTAWKVDGSAVTQPVSAASLPLPTGASTSALQTAGNTSVASIDTKTPALGQALAAASVPVVLTAAQVTTLTPPTTVTVTQATGTNLHTTIDNFPATQAISAASLPLPTGAATAANQATEIASLASIDAGIPAALGQTTMAASMPVTIASNQTAIPISGTITANSTVSTISDTGKGREYTSYSPDPSSYPDIISEVSLDYSDNTMIRGQVFSDEGSFRDDFTGSSLVRSLTGNIQWGGNDVSVTGTGSCLFTTETKNGQYVRKSSDTEDKFTQIDYIADDNHLFLKEGYLGSNGTTTGVVSDWKTLTPTGSSITVGSSLVNVISGTVSGNRCGITRFGDYLPYSLQGKISLTQRIANQTTIFGFQDSVTAPTKQCVIVFDGTDNTVVKFRTSSSSAASDIQETTVVLPIGTTAAMHIYQISLTPTQGSLIIDGINVVDHFDHIPGPYDNLGINFNIVNAAVVTTTTASADWIYFQNIDQLEITSSFPAEPIPVFLSDEPDTYSAVAPAIVAASAATDIFTITGSASKIIMIKKIRISGTQTTAGVGLIQLIKRSAVNTGGTSATITGVPHDASNFVATATIRSYTANPSALGAAIGTIRADRVYISSVTSVESPLEYIFGEVQSQHIHLRSATDVLSVNLNGATFAGNTFTCTVEWSEE